MKRKTILTPDEDAANAEDAAYDETAGVGDDSAATDIKPGDDGTADANGAPMPDPIRFPERFPGDAAADTRRFQIVLAAAQGILSAAPNTGPEALAARALQYADAVIVALDAPPGSE